MLAKYVWYQKEVKVSMPILVLKLFSSLRKQNILWIHIHEDKNFYKL